MLPKKVIYISFMRLSDKVSRDWYIDYLITQGVTVEYWDIVPLLFSGNELGLKKTDYLRTPRSYQEIQAKLRLPENKGAHYIMLVSYEGRTARLYRLLSKHGCRMFSIAWGELPINRGSRWRGAFVRLLANPVRFAQDFFYKVKAIIYRKLKLVKPYEVVFCAGGALLASAHYASKVVPINMVDYDHYVRVTSQKNRLTEESFAVFLDNYLPHHPDFEISGWPVMEPDGYYVSLNKFFKFVEVRYGIKVVIAAHPKADYGIETFQGRKIYRGLTPELVKDADFVMSHHSTSINYAVLNHKPIIFIYTDEMARLYKRTIVKFLHDFANYLDASLCNIDKITRDDQIVLPRVNEERYEDYKYNFLTTHETENVSTQEIFWREICVN